MIYFDNNATTALHGQVREAMLPYLEREFGNPNSVHQLGNRGRVAIEKARTRLAKALGVNASELVFTGSGSEANNQAILGTLLARWQAQPGKNVVISAIEHPSVSETARWAADNLGFELRAAPVTIRDGRVDVEPFTRRIDENTVLVSVMYANNETGIVLPVRDVFAHAKTMASMCHTDAVQAFGKLALAPRHCGADLMSVSAHKFHGPKGVGGLYIRRGVKLEAFVHGGPQENGRRAGTENVANIAGMGMAAEIAARSDLAALREVRDYFEAQLTAKWGSQIQINFQNLARTPNTSSVQFKGQDANLLLIKLDQRGICLSTGAACSSGSLTASKGLLAMGLRESEAASTLRFSFSKQNTKEEVDDVLRVLEKLHPIEDKQTESRSGSRKSALAGSHQR